MTTSDDAGAVHLSFRFAGGDFSKYERVRRDPQRLERYDMKRMQHMNVVSTGDRRARAASQRRPDLLVFASSLWSPTCERLQQLASSFLDASTSGAATLVQWVLLGSYGGPLEKFGWPETKWLCERTVAARTFARIRAAGAAISQHGGRTSAPRKHEKHRRSEGSAAVPLPDLLEPSTGGTTIGQAATLAAAAGSRSQIVDLKPLVAAEIHPEIFEECPMVRRELYGLASGGGIHWGPAMHDAWTQIALHALCGGG